MTPATTFGNWFSPFSRRQVFAAAMTSLNTISLAVVGESAPLVRTVRCRTVANTGKGNCYDNAVVETFKTLKSELVWRMVFHTRAEASEALAHYIDGFYNPIRRHSALDYVRCQRRGRASSPAVTSGGVELYAHGWRRDLMDVGDQALMRGLATAVPSVRPELSRSYGGRRPRGRPQSV